MAMRPITSAAVAIVGVAGCAVLVCATAALIIAQVAISAIAV